MQPDRKVQAAEASLAGSDGVGREELLRRWNALKSERSSWWPHWREISDNLLPRAGRYFAGDRNRGQKRHNAIYDSSATRDLRILAAGMMGGMTSPARPWMRLATPDKELEKSPAVKQWLADVTRLQLQVFARSNTYRALHDCYTELGAFGTWADVMLDDYETVLHHQPLTVGEYCIGANFRGDVDTLYREFDVTVHGLVTEFGLDAVSPHVRGLYSTGNLDQWVTIIHAIEPRRERDTRKRDAKNMAWRSVYFEAACDDKRRVLREGGFKSFPALCPRWATSGGDIYGHSPGMEALGDIKQLQHQQLRKANAIDYQVRPPLQLPSSMRNQETSFMPGGMNYTDNPAAAAGIRSAWDVNLRLDHLLQDMQDVRQRIRGAFNADMFLMLGGADLGRMTATEVAERHEEKLLMLGPVLERLHFELLSPLIERTFDRMVQADILPPAPPEMQGMPLNVEFVSMLAQAQRAIGINSIDRYVVTLGTVAQMKPEVLDTLDADLLAERYADRMGLDPDLVISGERLTMIRQQRAQAQAQAQAIAQAEQAASAAQKLGTVQTGQDANNAAASVLDAFTGYT
jgi:hypothetical protein